jgi:hypothetical protein
VVRRFCQARRADGQSCRAAPLVDRDFCAVHDPANAEAMGEARRLGGLRRKREVTLAGAYDFEGLTSVPQLRRLLEVAAFDLLSMDNSIPRARVIVAVVLAGAKLLEVGELEERIAALEAAVQSSQGQRDSLVDQADDFALEYDA